MAKIGAEAKQKYFERIKEYKSKIDQVLQKEKNYLQLIEKDDQGAEFKKLILADDALNMVSYYLLMNSVSLTLLGIKNEAFINDGRKGLYKSIIYLEEVVTTYLDAPYSEYEEYVEKIDSFQEEKRWAFICKLGFSIDSVREAFGENSKWKWSFVELEGRFAVITKNLLNLKTLIKGMDPREPGYEVRMAHLELTKSLLQKSADRYRQKYELSTSRIDDFKQAISFLAALRRLAIILGESKESDVIKKKIEIWDSKMKSDQKKSEIKK